MSSGGRKMVEMSYGVAENGMKWPENQEITGDPRWSPPPLRWPDPGASGGGLEISPTRSSRRPPPTCLARVQ